MVDTYIVWKITADAQVAVMVHELETNCDDDSEWVYMMSQIMEWARQKLLESQDSLFFVFKDIFFEDIYYSNWADAEHTNVKIEDNLLVITSRAPGVDWEKRISEKKPT